MKPHKHAELIKLWADGARVQYFLNGIWKHSLHPSWEEHIEYRIIPKSNNDIVYTTNIVWDKGWNWVNTTSTIKENLRLVFDGETGDLKSAEVL